MKKNFIVMNEQHTMLTEQTAILEKRFASYREKKELPNGKIISAVSPTGWELLDLNC